MNLSNLKNRLDDIESGAPSFKHYLNESVYSSPEMERHWKKLDEGFFKPYYQYLQEAALTADQIQNIFKQVGSQGGAAPANTAKEAEKLVDKVLPAEHAANLAKNLPDADAGPVQGFDQKAQAAIDNIPNADAETKQGLMQMIKAGIQKPETQQLILSALGGGIGGIVGKLGWAAGPVGAAATGALVAGVVSIAAAKMQGQDWKSAFKGAIKPALMGGAGAVVGNLAAQAASAGINALSNKASAPDATASLDNPKASSGQGVSGDLDRQSKIINKPEDFSDSGMRIAGQPVVPGEPLTPQQMAVMKMSMDSGNSYPPEVMAQYNAQSGDGATMQPKGGVTLPNPDGSRPPGSFTGNDQVALNQRAQQQADWANGINPPPEWIKNHSTGKYEPPSGQIGQPLNPGIAPIGANGEPMRQVPMDPPPKVISTRAYNNGDPADPAVMAQIRARQEYLRNNPAELAKIYGDGKSNFEESAYDRQATLKEWLRREKQGLALTSVQLKSKVVEGIFKFLNEADESAAPAAAKGATADSLNQAWVAAGSPTDSEEVAKILQQAGIDADTITKIYTDLKIPAPGAAEPAGEKPATTEPAGNKVNISSLLTRIKELTDAEQQQIIAVLQGN